MGQNRSIPEGAESFLIGGPDTDTNNNKILSLASAAEASAAITDAGTYRVCGNTSFWYRVDGTAAAATAPAIYVAAEVEHFVELVAGATISAIQDTTAPDGKVSVARWSPPA